MPRDDIEQLELLLPKILDDISDNVFPRPKKIHIKLRRFCRTKTKAKKTKKV